MEAAYEYLVKYESASESPLRYSVTCGTGDERGVYLREAHQLVKPSDVTITVEPNFMDNHTGTNSTSKTHRCLQMKQFGLLVYFAIHSFV